MFFWVISNAVISLVIIILIHYLYVFFKTNLTVPKIKDLVERPEKKYKEIYASLSTNTAKESTILKPKKDEGVDMKLELKNYLKGLETTQPQQDMAPAEKYDFFSNNYEQL
jgi:hypothetical protein